MVGWQELSLRRRASRDSLEPVQTQRMLSLNLFQKSVRWGSFSRNYSSRFPMKSFTYEVDILVPITVPWVCWKVCVEKEKPSHLRTMSKRVWSSSFWSSSTLGWRSVGFFFGVDGLFLSLSFSLSAAVFHCSAFRLHIFSHL